MKFSSTVEPQPAELSIDQRIKFPSGLVGFPQFGEAEIIYKPEELPFMWLRATSEGQPSFLVVEPASVVPGYEIDITDADVEALGLKNANEALVLTIATLHRGPVNSLTLNLIGPVVVNRRTLQARQVIIGNAHKYSARHLLFETKEG